MRDIATGRSRTSQALGTLVPLPSTEHEQPARTVQLRGFRDAEGHSVKGIELRVHRGGLDGAGLIIAHIDPEPCLQIGPLAERLGAHDLLRIPPSPHNPDGRGGVRGYAFERPDGGALQIVASDRNPQCVTIITARQPVSEEDDSD